MLFPLWSSIKTCLRRASNQERDTDRGAGFPIWKFTESISACIFSATQKEKHLAPGSCHPSIASVTAARKQRETRRNPSDKCKAKWSYQLKAIFRPVHGARDSGFSPPSSIMSLQSRPRYTMPPPNYWHMDPGSVETCLWTASPAYSLTMMALFIYLFIFNCT